MGTSATAGYLQATDTGADLNDQALDVFLQAVVAGITTLAGSSVRPRFQEEPAAMPAASVDWAAIGVMKFESDTFAAVQHRGAGEGMDIEYRNQILEVLCSFYGPHARSIANTFSLGLQIAQNREQLQLAGFGLVEVQDAVLAPELTQEKWRMRVDVPFRLRRAQQYSYAVRNLLGVAGTVHTDTNIAQAFSSQNSLPTSLPLFGWDLGDKSMYAGWDSGSWRE